MSELKEWEIRVREDNKNQWVVTTSDGKFVCKKVKGRFFVKDCDKQLQVSGEVLSSGQL